MAVESRNREARGSGLGAPDRRRGLWGLMRLRSLLALPIMFGVSAALVPLPAGAEPVFDWTPPAVAEELRPGNSRLVSVGFTANEDVAQANLRVVPELEPFVQVAPRNFQGLAAGQMGSLEILFSVPPDAAPAIFEGTMQLRDGIGPSAQNLAKPLAVTLTILEPPPGGGLPPDPGDAGKATLEGIDSDGDGIRDDIQRFIVLNHPDSARLRAALTQYTRAVQEALLVRDDKALSLDAASKASRGNECLWFLLGEQAPDIKNELLARILNTVERSRAYLTYNAQLFGGIFPIASQLKLSCAFDPDALPN